MVWGDLGGLGAFWDASTDPEKINYMPVCRNLAGNKMGQKYDGRLVKFSTSEDRMTFCLFCFSMFRTLIYTKVFF